MTIRAFPLLGGLLACASPFVLTALAQAQTPAEKPGADETIVVTGSKASGGEFGAKSGIPLDKLPQSVQILTSSDLADRGVVSMGDALRAIPSANPGASRTSPYQSFTLKIRGFLADQMRNGVRQRYYEDVDASSLSNVERIEVLKGPSAVLYGESAVGGIISIITKRPREAFGWGGSLTAGSDERFTASFDVTGPISASAGLYARATAEIERSGTFIDFMDMDRENFGLSFTWSPSESVTTYLVLEWQRRKTLRNPGLPVIGTVVSNGVGEVDHSAFLGEPRHSDLESQAPLVQLWSDIGLGGGWTLTPRLSYSGFETEFRQIRLRAMQADGVTVNRNGRYGHEDDHYTIAQLDLSGSFATGSIGHSLLLGIEYDRERGSFYQENMVGVPSINTLNPVYAYSAADPAFVFGFDNRYNVDGVSLYAQDVIDLTPDWNVVAGLRWSNIRSFGNGYEATRVDHWTWQLGTTYDLGGGLSLYGGYNTGFDIESSAGSLSRDGSPFEPEVSDQGELGLRYQGESVRLSASIFQIRRTNVLTADPVDPDYSIQTGEVRVRGFELEGAFELTPGLTVEGGYAYLDGEVTKSNNGDQGGAIADMPKHSASLFVTWRSEAAPLELRGGLNYYSSRALLNGSAIRLPEYTTVDLGASYDFDAVRVSLIATNVFDERYFAASGNAFAVYAGDPRQISLTISRSF